MADLRPLLQPESLAVVGASGTPGKAGYILLDNIRRGGYRGRVYPINPRADTILGWKAYPSILDTPEPVDLAFLVVPREATVDVLRACAEKGVRAAVIITAGFREVGGEGARLHEAVEAVIRSSGILATGPNTIGLVSAPARLIGTFVPFETWHDGPVAILGQTGLYAGAMMNEYMAQRFQHPEIRYSLTVGNKIGVDEVDFLDYVKDDDAVRAVGLHLEGIRDPAKLVRAAAEVNARKPVVVLKGGRTGTGMRASLAHTGSAPMDVSQLDAALDAAGVARAEDIEDLLGTLKLLTWQPLPPGRRVAVATWTGSQGVIAMDQIEQAGLRAAEPRPETMARIQALFPDWFPALNPVDIWIVLERDGAHRTEQVFRALLDDDGVDAVLGVVLAIEGGTFPEVRRAFSAILEHANGKPVSLVIWGPDKERWLAELQGLHLPVYPTTRAAVRALAAAARYAEVRTAAGLVRA